MKSALVTGYQKLMDALNILHSYGVVNDDTYNNIEQDIIGLGGLKDKLPKIEIKVKTHLRSEAGKLLIDIQEALEDRGYTEGDMYLPMEYEFEVDDTK